MTTPSTVELSPLAVGTKAPDFDLPASGGVQVKLSDYAGKNLIIVFYPKDQTPGCTKQLCALQADTEKFKALNTAFIGSNPASQESHERFSEKEGYTFPIVVDAERTMARDYHALKEDCKGIQRTVYIVDETGVIRYAEQGLPSDEVLMEAIKGF
ncbi:MAG: peroxiredoxin [Cyanobacteria bacterium P01_H01_bin.74]